MKHFWLFFLFLSLILMCYTYLFYPFILWVLSKFKNQALDTFGETDDLPFVSVIMPVHNEESVLNDKIHSLKQLHYPKDKIIFYIGSDASNDYTNAILHTEFDFAKVYFNTNRTGKPGMVNILVSKAFEFKPAGPDHILLFTDASVMLEPSCLFHLVKYYKNPKMGLVDANMQNLGIKKDNISFAESSYVSMEVKIKHWESIVFNKMVGPFGGCFTIRSNYFEPIPDNFLVDDFYLCMQVFKKSGWAINSIEALSFESVSQELREEFRRKSRIASGNIQNLSYFNYFLSKDFRDSVFAIYSHKVIRWFVPVLALIFYISLSMLSISHQQPFFNILVSITIILICIPLLEIIFSKLKIVVSPIKSLNYFLWMNVALLKGFFGYLKGIKSNVWKPTKRY